MKPSLLHFALPALLSTALFCGAQTVTFSIPGAGTADQQGTFPTGVNLNGVITGYYVDSSGDGHGFTYNRGVISTFNAFGGSFTTPLGINASGTVVGNFTANHADPNGTYFGFTRTAGGAYTIIQAAPPGNTSTTFPYAINDSGQVVGVWTTEGGGGNGFLYSNGTVATFNPVGSVDTIPTSISASGEIAGFYQNSDGSTHGFVRDPSGAITSFDPPGSVGTWAYAVNSSGQIAGYYNVTGNEGINQLGFIRNIDDTFTSFVVSPGSAFTFEYSYKPMSINDSGEIAGVSEGLSGTLGWTRSPQGVVREFSVCGKTAVTGLNNAGRLVGYCGDNPPGLISYDGFSR